MSKSFIDFDVIVPIYNCEDYLERCLHSLITSGENIINIVLVDDGSTDNSGKIADDYAATYSNVRVIHKENGGLSSARNAGLAIVEATYFTFIDPDDWVSKNYFISVSDELQKTKVDILMTPYTRVYSDASIDTFVFGNKVSIFGKTGTRDVVLKRLYGLTNSELSNPLTVDNLSTAWAKFYKTDKFAMVRFTDKSEVYSEDLWFNINCFLKAQSSEYFNKPMYYYFKENENSIVHTFNDRMLEQYKRLYNLMYDYILKYNLGDDFIEALNNRIVINELSILRNASLSNESFRKKTKHVNKILTDEIYSTRYNDFDFKYLPSHFSVFYRLCKCNMSLLVISMLYFGEKLKKKIKQ